MAPLSGKRILVLNAGSSSLKASVLDVHASGRIPSNSKPVAATQTDWGSDATRVTDRRATVEKALKELWHGDVTPESIEICGHRVVHGGTRFVQPTLVDDSVLAGIEALSDLAPLHNVVALDTIRAQRALLPTVPQVACFDTAFHATLSEDAYVYPLPFAWYEEWGIRRFGFHGLSVEWSLRRAAEELARPADEVNLIVAHLGSGCSVTAVASGKSVSTSMGLTPLEGVMMGTRSGSVDPGILVQVMRRHGVSADRLEEVLDHESGLLGVSGLSGEMKAVAEAASSGNQRARLAIDIFVRRAAAGIAVAATSLPRVDALIFTGGIGEHAADIRAAIADRLVPLGLGPGSMEVLTVTAREDIVIAEGAAAISG